MPRRPSRMPVSEVPPLDSASNFLFMPTPVIGINSVAQFTNYCPPLNELGSSTNGESFS